MPIIGASNPAFCIGRKNSDLCAVRTCLSLCFLLSQSFSNSNDGTLSSPFIGEFKDGRAELFAQDTFNDKAILVRAVWSNITAKAHRYEEFFSDDGGRTWRLSFTANKTRI
jgi:hypothetical protein